MSKPRVLLIHPTIYPEGIEILKENCDIIYAPDGQPETIKKFLTEGVDGVIVRTEYLTKDLIESAKGLKVIGVNGVGYSNVDVQAATNAGIYVVNVVGANYYTVAEHVVMFALAMSRDLRRADQAVRCGHWRYRDEHLLHDIHNNTFFSVGFGHIGKEVCRVMHLGFTMNIVVYDPYFQETEINKLGYTYVDTFEAGAKNADFISLHLPSNSETFHMINKNTIKSMKYGCKFINCARGPIVDYNALSEALRSGQIGMAGIDVFPEEPVPQDHEILKLDNVLVTPHCAGDTVEARTRIAMSIANDVVAVLSDRAPRCLVNKELITK